MKKSLQKGFTLIELLVVIAIIGILSSVVLASLTTARTKGKDAAVQSQLSSIRAQAELFYASNGNSYNSTGSAVSTCSGNMFATTSGALALNSTGRLIDSIYAQGVIPACAINAGGSAWAVSAPMVSSSSVHYCADSAGNSLATTSAVGVAAACK